MKQCLDGEPSLRAASALLLGKLQGAVRKRAGVASECRHINRLRPTVGRVMIDLAATHQRHEPPAALLDGTSFSASCGVGWRFGVYSQSFLLQCSDAPLIKHLVGRVDEIRLSRPTNIRAKKDPRVCPLHKVSSAL